MSKRDRLNKKARRRLALHDAKISRAYRAAVKSIRVLHSQTVRDLKGGA